MIAQDWLQANAPGYDHLTEEERSVIADFTFLWTFFEATALHENGSVPAIIAAVTRWSNQNLIPQAVFEAELTYFIDRYYAAGAPTYHFAHLNFRPNDRRDLVEQVLGRNVADSASVTTALLIIVFRYRNNLFHGLKWAYQLQDQLGNFRHANAVLMGAVDFHHRDVNP